MNSLGCLGDEEKKFIGKKVMVYRNLHKDTFSIQYKSRIVLYADYVKLNDVEFRVFTLNF